jgi:4-hydroxy-3-methylbut-2-enyl diphosphate reductase
VRLVEVALQSGAGSAYRVDRAGEIEDAWLEGATTVGVTSGASVPEILVQDVIAHLAARGFGAVEEVRTATEELMFSLPRELRAGLKAAGQDDKRPRRGDRTALPVTPTA